MYRDKLKLEQIQLALYTQNYDDSYCVPMSIYMLCDYYDISKSFDLIKKTIKSHKKQGTNLQDLKTNIKKLNLKLKRIKFTPAEIRKSIKKQIPVAISYVSAKNEYHFSLISGHFRQNKIDWYTLTDPLFGCYNIPHSVLNYLHLKDKETGASILAKVFKVKD